MKDNETKSIYHPITVQTVHFSPKSCLNLYNSCFTFMGINSSIYKLTEMKCKFLRIVERNILTELFPLLLGESPSFYVNIQNLL